MDDLIPLIVGCLNLEDQQKLRQLGYVTDIAMGEVLNVSTFPDYDIYLSQYRPHTLSFLNLSQCNITSINLSDQLNLITLYISDNAITVINGLPRLIELRIGYNRRFNGVGLGSFPKLEHLDANGCNICVNGLNEIMTLNLSTLALTLPTQAYTSEIVIAWIPQLRSLQLFNVSSNTLLTISQLLHLQCVEIGSFNLTDAELGGLSVLSQLTTLCISDNTTLSGSFLCALNLTRLILLDTNIEVTYIKTQICLSVLAYVPHDTITVDLTLIEPLTKLDYLQLNQAELLHCESLSRPLKYIDVGCCTLPEGFFPSINTDTLVLTNADYDVSGLAHLRNIHRLDLYSLSHHLLADALPYISHLHVEYLNCDRTPSCFSSVNPSDNINKILEYGIVVSENCLTHCLTLPSITEFICYHSTEIDFGTYFNTWH